MRIECPHCGELVPAHIEELSARGVGFRCSSCQLRIDVAVSAEPSDGDSDTSGDQCPKCKRQVVATDSACRSCGLATELFAEFENSGPALGSERLAASWAIVQEDWHNEASHKAFLQEVAASSSYKEGAHLYRAAAEIPGQEASARLNLGRVQSMASAALFICRPKVEEDEEPFRAVVMLLIALVLIAGAGGLYVMMKSKEQHAEYKTPKFRSPTPLKSGGR